MSLIALALIQAVAPTVPTASVAIESTMPPARQELDATDMLLLAVSLDGLTITDGLTAFGDPQQPWLPIGELARLLDLDLSVVPGEGRVEGVLGEDQRALVVDFSTVTARVDGSTVTIPPGAIGFTAMDIYVRADVLARLLPIDFIVDAEGLAITLKPRETLPIQARASRLQRIQTMGHGSSATGETPYHIETPFNLVTPPAFDVILEAARDSRRPETFFRRYDLRLAGDLLYTNVQAYLGSDGTGTPSTARFLMERRSADGALPFGATRISAGDVYTPTLALGPRSIAGRGLSISTAPPSQAGVLNTIDLRGELPIGYDVELYVNDVLRSGQRIPVEGRYEFLDVQLVRGINVIRIVTYGPRGERLESVRVINAGGGLLPKGQTSFDIGIIQQKPLFQLRALPGEDNGTITDDDPRITFSVAHGLSETISLIGGASLYTSRAGDERQMLTGGIRASLAGFAVQLDTAADQTGGRAIATGATGNLLGSSVSFRHAEYSGDFIDEAGLVDSADRSLSRKSLATVNANLRLGDTALPLSLRVIRDGFTDGGTSWIGSLRTSTSVMRTLFSAGLDYVRDNRADGFVSERMTGNFDLSRLVNYTWQLRASVSYDALPAARMRTASATIDRSIGDRMAMRLGVGRAFGEVKDNTVQAGLVLRMPFGELSLTSDYATANKDWRTGLRFAFGSLFDPSRKRYIATPPGPATSASATLHAFIDSDGDGRFGAGDEAVPQVVISGGRAQASTGENGKALVTGLGISPTGRLQVDASKVDQLYLITPPGTVEFAPRPGQVMNIPYAMVPAGEVFGHVILRQDGRETGLSAVRMQLMRAGLPPLTATTEFDGTIMFSNVPPGTYQLELDPKQAKALHMRLREPVTLHIAADAMQDVTAEIVFDREGV